MENRETNMLQLQDAVLVGDLRTLLTLLQEDPHILDRCIDPSGGTIRTPLHAASAKGHLEIVKHLLTVNPSMCFSRDQDGRIPFHMAAIYGQVPVLEELFKAKPQAAQERTSAGETVLHLCLKQDQYETLKFLVNLTHDGELLNCKDADENTVLHLAVAAKNLEVVEFLLKQEMMEKTSINRNGSTAMDVLNHCSKKDDANDLKLKKCLKRAKVVKAEDTRTPLNHHRAWLDKQRSALKVVASLLATMAFAVGINPPGGVWQDSDGHTAGMSIMADLQPSQYKSVMISNTIGLVSSLSVILLLVSGLPSERPVIVVLMMAMWISVSAAVMAYYFSVASITSVNDENGEAVLLAIIFSFLVWILLVLYTILRHAIRLIIILIKQLIRIWGCCFTRSRSTTTPSPPV